jgi:hypothetical protein
MKKLLFTPPNRDSLLRLLSAWRIWLGGAILGSLIASLVYLVHPPMFRAQATVLVNQHVEQVIPKEQNDLRRFNFLARETDKLIAIAWADKTLAPVSEQTGIPVSSLRDGRLLLSQPADGGWHFLADAGDAKSAAFLAEAWAAAFVQEVQAKPTGINPLLEINFTQQHDLPVFRTVSLGAYVFGGALIGIALLALILLFFDWKNA